MFVLRQSTAVDVLIGPFLDRNNLYAEETGETPAVKLSKNGQALAAKNDVTVPVHDADGYYNCELDATDTNTVGTLVLSVASTANAAPVRHEFQVVEEAIYDTMYAAGASSQSGNYEGGQVWIDSDDGSAGTTLGINGTVTNPVDSLADALTVAAAGNLKGLHFSTGSSITLAASLDGFVISGDNYTLALGGQSISGTIFEKFGPVTGTATGAIPPVFNGGPIGTVTLPPSVFINAGFYGTLTANGNGNYQFNDCHSQVAGSGAPAFDFSGQGATTTAQFRRWSGGVTLTLDSNCTVSIDVVSGGTVTINGTGGSVVVRGVCNVVDGSSGAVSITQSSVINMTKINSEVDLALVDYDAATGAEASAISAKIDTVDSVADAIKLKTDNLNFTVSNQVDANIQSVNDITVTGTGASGNEWGP